MIASQELEPGHGWDYRALQVARRRPGATVDELGAALVDGFEGQAEEEATDSEITLSLIDLTRCPPSTRPWPTSPREAISASVDLAPVVGRTRPAPSASAAAPIPSEDTQ